MHWACTRLSTLPDPTKPVWEQDAVILDMLIYVEAEIAKEANRVEGSE